MKSELKRSYASMAVAAALSKFDMVDTTYAASRVSGEYWSHIYKATKLIEEYQLADESSLRLLIWSAELSLQTDQKIEAERSLDLAEAMLEECDAPKYFRAVIEDLKGRIYKDTRSSHASIAHHQASLDALLGVFDEDDPSSIDARINYATSLASSCLYNEAIEILKKCQSAILDKRGIDCADYAYCSNNLGRIFLEAGKFLDAKERFLEAVAYFANRQGSGRKEFAICLGNLGHVEMLLGELQEAEKHLDQCLAVTEVEFGVQHTEYGRICSYHGSLYLQKNSLDDARSKFERYIEIARTNRGEKSVEFCFAMLNRVKVLRRFGKQEEALSTIAEVVNIVGNLYELDRRSYLAYMECLVGLLRDTDRIHDSITAGEAALRFVINELGGEHPIAAGLCEELAISYANSGKFAKAEKGFLLSIRLRELIAGTSDSGQSVHETKMRLNALYKRYSKQ